MPIPKQIGNCQGCDASLWNDKLGHETGWCGSCRDAGRIADLEAVIKGSLKDLERALALKRPSWQSDAGRIADLETTIKTSLKDFKQALKEKT